MRNLVKYFLVLAVMGGGFYAAQQHRRPSGGTDREAMADRQLAGRAADEATPTRAEPAPSAPLPVAALADVDRVPLVGSDRLDASADTRKAKPAGVTHQPTLRAEQPAVPAPATDSTKKDGPEAAKSESSQQIEDKPQPKKQNPKRAAAAKPQGQEKDEAHDQEQKKELDGTQGKNEDKHRDKNFVPPELASEYRPRGERAEVGKEATSRPEDPPARQETASEKPVVAQAKSKPKAKKPAPEAASETAPRRHRIAEGDTLTGLAEKYLGSRERYLDLFQANTDVLFDARLIPIGVEIVIPERSTVVAQGPPPAAAIEDD